MHDKVLKENEQLAEQIRDLKALIRHQSRNEEQQEKEKIFKENTALKD